MYKSDDGRVPIDEFLYQSHRKVKSKFDYMIKYIQDEKNVLCEPYVKHFQIYKYKMFYELRLKAAGTTVRIIYYITNNNIILLHAFYKRDKRDTEQALEYSLKLLNKLEENPIEIIDKLKEVPAI